MMIVAAAVVTEKIENIACILAKKRRIGSLVPFMAIMLIHQLRHLHENR